MNVNLEDYGPNFGGDCEAALLAAYAACGSGGGTVTAHVPSDATGKTLVGADGLPLPFGVINTAAGIRQIAGLPNGVTLRGEDRRDVRFVTLPGSTGCTLLGGRPGAQDVALECLSIGNTSAKDHHEHAIVFSGTAAAPSPNLRVHRVTFEGVTDGDAVYFGDYTSGIELDWVAAQKCARASFTFAGKHTHDVVMRHCLAAGFVAHSRALGFENEGIPNEDETLDGRIIDVLIERCRFEGPVSLGLTRRCTMRDTEVYGSIVAGNARDLLIEDVDSNWDTFAGDPSAGGGPNGDGHRAFHAYKSAKNITLRRFRTVVHGPGDGLVFGSLVTGIVLDGCEVETDLGRVAVVGAQVGNTVVRTHAVGA